MKKLNQTIFVVSTIIIVLILGVRAGKKQQKSDNPHPNIVLILADDMGYECLGCNGSTEYKTPILDKLAANGICFDHCYSQPLCTPSRVKLMTGKYNYRNYEDFGYLNPDQVTFANLLHDKGYKTCVAGKWQLNGIYKNTPGSEDVNRPYEFGFDEYCLWQLNHLPELGERYANPLITQNGKDMSRDHDKYGPDIFCDYICNFIKRNARKPFFVYYPMVLIHDPFVPTPDSPDWANRSMRYKRDTTYFRDMVAYTDKIVKKIRNVLVSNNLWDNTVFIFVADNGTHTSIISKTEKRDVKGGKGYSINTGNHVPLIISWPDKIRKPMVFHGIVDFADFLPTLADVAGIKPSEYSTDGKSFFNVLIKNEETTKSETFIHYSPRWGKFKHNRWVMDGVYKLYKDGRFFNTLNDPDEKSPIVNLSFEEKKVKTRFKSILQSKENEFPFEWNNKSFNYIDNK